MKKQYVLASAIFFLFVSIAHGAGDSFQIRTFVGTDIIPPTTPSNLVATPVAYTQIDLSWGTSTDDFILGGYQVFRDSIQIATTTQTNYADGGLTASTTYTYYVKAFDNSFNISSSSNSIATTTFIPAATSTAASTSTSTRKIYPGGSGPGNVKLLSFLITPSLYSADVTWQTNQFAQFELRWGRTTSYELGFVTNQVFEEGNDTRITDLEPGTVYEYELIAYDKNGIKTTLSEGQFKTLDAPDTTPPSNVSDLKAAIAGNDVRLSWIDPTENDFDHVRVVRNYMFYPVDPYDGYVSYQDKGTAFTDPNALLQKTQQYYTVFSYDKSGNICSGAIVAVYKEQVSGNVVPTQATSTTPIASSSPLQLQFSDFEFVQDGAVVASDAIDATEPLTMRIAYDKLPEHLKAITGSLALPNDPQSTFSFLFKINNDKTYYEVSLAALKTTGIYPVTLSVYDFSLQELSKAQGSITVVPHSTSNYSAVPLHFEPTQMIPLLILIAVLFMVLIYSFYKVLKDLGYGIRIKDSVDRTKLTISILIFCLCGGSCAFVIATLLGYGSDTPTAAMTTQAAVDASQTASPVSFGVLPLLLLCGLIIILLLFYISRRSKK